ncbi:MAG TPA: response regulator [Caulobacteraceae bacterium]
MDTRIEKTAADVSFEVLRQLEAMSELAARLKGGEDVGGSARALAESAEDVRRLVEQARDLQRAELGELTFEPRVAKLRDVLAAVEDAWRERAANMGVGFTVSYEGEADQAGEFDPNRLAQLFDVLIGRAFAETRTGAIAVSLRSLRNGERLTLEGCVRDSGRSLSAGQLAHIFDQGAEAQASLSTRVGMALANRVVQAMAGVLQAQVNDGGGVSVTFDLMVPAAEIEGPRAPHVLIVDDNATNRMVAEALCEMFDCTSEQAKDGVEAIEAVKTRAYDLILMDIRMPRMDGVEATRAIRALAGPVGATPIVAMTANTEKGDVRTYLEAGMNDIVEKPVKPERLSQVLQQLPGWAQKGRTAAA